MSNHRPPKWADWLVSRLCPIDDQEEVQGDLHEAFHWRAETIGSRRAKAFFIWEAFRSIRITRFRPIQSITQKLMIQRNYIKTGWRFLKKNKGYATLNIFGLALGISFCWLAYLYANDETSFDKHLSLHDRLYRITIDFMPGDDIRYIGGSSNAMSVAFNEKIPEVETIARLKPSFGIIEQETGIIEQPFLMTDRSIADMLDLTFLEGQPGDFELPNDAIISEALAGKLNLRGKAVGEIISITQADETVDFIIRGVYKDIPVNTSIQSDMMVPFSYYEANAPSRRLTTWFDINMNTLIQLAEGADRARVEEKMLALHTENKKDLKAEVAMHLQPIYDIHLNPNYGHYNGIRAGGNTELIRLFVIIGLFCLIISMINYSNFNISLYINRAREVALRKVIGARKAGIFNQLITESFLSSFIAAVFAAVILLVILPYFSSFVRKSYEVSFLLNSDFLLGAGLILLVAALFSGLYPALVLSRFSILKSLKGEQKVKSGKWITQTLLGIQFIIATALVAAMLTMNKQVNYLSSFDTKMDTQNVFHLGYLAVEEEQVMAFMNDLNQLPQVADFAGISGYNGTGIRTEDYQVDVRHLRVERDFINMMGIEVIKGRNFDPEITTDQTQNILVNEELVKQLGLEDPMGEVIPFEYGDLKNPTIIGVVENYHFRSAKVQMEPLVIYQSPQYPIGEVYVKTSGSTADLDAVEAVWKKHFDPYPFEYESVQEEYQAAYRSDALMLQLVSIGCGVSIFLAAMGLLGIIGLQLKQRLKEISIRKVLGATSSTLYQVTTKHFVITIVIGLALGTLAARQVITKWLENYPYSISFSWELIATSLIITISIAFLTMIIQVLKVIKANPVEYLRDE